MVVPIFLILYQRFTTFDWLNRWTFDYPSPIYLSWSECADIVRTNIRTNTDTFKERRWKQTLSRYDGKNEAWILNTSSKKLLLLQMFWTKQRRRKRLGTIRYKKEQAKHCFYAISSHQSCFFSVQTSISCQNIHTFFAIIKVLPIKLS